MTLREKLRHLRLVARGRVRRMPRLYTMVRLLKYGPYRGFTGGQPCQDLLAQARAEGWRVLHLGSGGRHLPGMVNVDIDAETGPDVVANGHELPFADGCFDLIWCEFVVEHVEDPEAFLAHASRCLRPGGYWCLTAPFLQPFHAGADFGRWTRAGFQAALRRAGLEPVAAGTFMGPGFMLAWILREWIALLLSLGFAPLRQALRWLLLWPSAPLLLTDLLLLRLRGADELACDTWHIARRPGTAPGG
ncbi:class I SAM-dependent methyltransferase [Roseomonas stagni]|uniref:Class I SAM-dependent methyltransferase n=1 Tax=Falsiroseomonas algicola TaxID=2716930 RepID=A0A6M1LUT4_9PROT|nr:class I SAM-dependent methyltransferase [Falsiroseomonas algicola]NGM24201.1 class I SAM-dependent methyltransferase [Falsiroseomonas algicola]